MYGIQARISRTFQYFVVVFFLLFIANIVVSAASPKTCGNGVCQQSQGENTETCPADCGTPPVLTPTPVPTTPPTPNPTGITATPTSVPGGGGVNPTSTPQPSSSGGSTNETESDTANASPLSQSSVSLTGPVEVYTSSVTPQYTGTVSVQQGTIMSVEYSIDGGGWIAADPADGSFNSQSEEFRFITPSLTDGAHEVRIRGRNNEGVFSRLDQYVVSRLVIVLDPPKIIFPPITPNPTSNQSPTIRAQMQSPFPIEVTGDVSIDGGVTWQRMIRSGVIYTRKMSSLEDDNYSVVVRATDAAGNSVISDPQTLIVDTIPPVIGGATYTLGSQVLTPDETGTTHLVVGTKSTLFIGTKGGVTEVIVRAGDAAFPLLREKGSHLWYGDIVFDKSGTFEMEIMAKDGADNQTKRVLHTIVVQQQGKVLTADGKSLVSDAKVTAYYYQSASRQWRLWDGVSFGEVNPRFAQGGGYSFMLPRGKYYLEVAAPGYRKAVSDIIDIENPTIINAEIKLNKTPSVAVALPVFGRVVLAFPTIIPDVFSVAPPVMTVNKESGSHVLIGKAAPSFTLPDRDGNMTKLSSYAGAKTLLIFFAPWSTGSLEQIRIISDLSSAVSKKQRIVMIALQESEYTINTLMNRGKYAVEMLADNSGITAADYHVSLLPMQVWIGTDGVVRDIHVGVMGSGDIIQKFGNLP